MPVRAVLFDFDGTLADSFPAITASTNHTRSLYGLPPLTEAAVREAVGLGLDQLMDELVPGADPAEAVAAYRVHHETVFLTHTTLLPGVADALETLHARGVLMGVCSNKRVDFTRRLVAHLGLAGAFGTVLGPEDVSAPKPDPAMLLEGCRRLGVSPADTIYVGDMAVDVHAGRAGGVRVWLVPGGATGRENPVDANPDRVLLSFAEIAGLVG